MNNSLDTIIDLQKITSQKLIYIIFIESFHQLQGKVESIVGYAKPDIKEVLKDIRRKNKNKDSAASSRHKKLNRIQQLRMEKKEKEKTLDSTKRLISANQVMGKKRNFRL